MLNPTKFNSLVNTVNQHYGVVTATPIPVYKVSHSVDDFNTTTIPSNSIQRGGLKKLSADTSSSNNFGVLKKKYFEV